MVSTSRVLYHLDSSACVAMLRLPLGQVPALLHGWNVGDVGISSIVAAEMEVGVHKSAHPQIQRGRLEFLYARTVVSEFDSEAARQYGEIRAELKAKGAVIGPMDLLIAAHARSLGATLVTINVKEFRRVRGLKVLAWK